MIRVWISAVGTIITIIVRALILIGIGFWGYDQRIITRSADD